MGRNLLFTVQIFYHPLLQYLEFSRTGTPSVPTVRCFSPYICISNAVFYFNWAPTTYQWLMDVMASLKLEKYKVIDSAGILF